MAGEGEYAPKRMDAIKLAKGSKWEELKKLVDAEPLTAQQIDSYGMLPLHWACTEPHSISETVLMSLLKAFPQGARATNTAEMLPLQIAIKAQAKIEWLQALLASYPDAVLKKAPSGENAVQLARKSNLPARSVKLLEEMYHHVCEKAGYSSDQMGYDDHEDYPTGREDRAPGQHTGSSRGGAAYASNSISGLSLSSRGRGPDSYKSRALSDNDYQLMNTADLYRSTSGDSFRATSVSSVSSINGGLKPMQYQPNSRGSSRSVVALPPRWMIAPNCHICSLKFGPFRKRHHCRNCGQSICGDHSARERMRLPHYGLSDRHRVCTVCHDLLRNGLMLQPNQPRTTQTQMLPNRRSDEAVQRLPDAPNTSYQLERHVSAPARPNNLDAQYNGIHDQVASLQKQVSILMEEKELAESQLRAQAELLSETLDPERLSRRGSRGRDRLNSFPTKLSPNGSSPAGTSTNEMHQTGSHSGQMYNSYEAGGKMMQRTNSSSSFRGREVDIDRPSTDAPPPPPPVPAKVAMPEPVASSSPVAPLQDEFANMSLVESTYSDGSEERPTEGFGDLHDADETYDSTQEFADDDEGDDGTLPEVDVMVNLGLSMMENGMVSAAVQAFARAVDICPNDATLHSYLGRAYYADDNLDDAVVAITKSLELEPSATNSTLLGKILFEKGDHEKAIEAYQKSLEIQQSKD